MKNFRVQIHAYGHTADFTISAENTAKGIEQSILDKLGKNEVKFESNGFTRKDRKWITYEEVTSDPRPVYTKEVLGVRVATGTPEGGQI
tara:strand:+ start:417 stop:683 length:267 start_codon:yes stop_codon:yes gene_type:complete